MENFRPVGSCTHSNPFTSPIESFYWIFIFQNDNKIMINWCSSKFLFCRENIKCCSPPLAAHKSSNKKCFLSLSKKWNIFVIYFKIDLLSESMEYIHFQLSFLCTIYHTVKLKKKIKNINWAFPITHNTTNLQSWKSHDPYTVCLLSWT